MTRVTKKYLRMLAGRQRQRYTPSTSIPEIPQKEITREKELMTKLLAICAGCPHIKWIGGKFVCDRPRTECHSARVRAYLKELEGK